MPNTGALVKYRVLHVLACKLCHIMAGDIMVGAQARRRGPMMRQEVREREGASHALL